MSTFGTGDYGGYNNWVASGLNTFWTNWCSQGLATGSVGRVNALAARWDGWTGGATGHNDAWGGSAPVPRQIVTGDFNVGTGSGSSETMHNVGCNDYWQNQAAFFLGFWRNASQSSIFGFQNGAWTGYTGKSGDDLDQSGAVADWNGGSQGGLPVYGSVTDTQVWVFRSGAWRQVWTYVWRSGAYSGPIYVYVYRSGAWQILDFADFMTRSERHIPERGMPVMVDVGQGLERGWATEDGSRSWFGNVNPEQMDYDWRELGHHRSQREFWFDGRYNSHEPAEVADRRARAYDAYRRLLAAGNPEEAITWWPKFQPSGGWQAVPTPARTVIWIPAGYRPRCRRSRSATRPGRNRLSTISSAGAVPTTCAPIPASASSMPIPR